MRPPIPITDYLAAWQAGDAAALDAVVAELYEFLHDRAHQALRKEKEGHVFQTTDLVNEVYMKLRKMKNVPDFLPEQGTSRFVGLAAHLMRNILLDYARSRDSDKRGGKIMHVALELVDLPEEHRYIDIAIVNEILERLQVLDPELVALVEQRFFLGMTVEEIAEARGVHRRTVQREWTIAKRFLSSQLSMNAGESHD